MRRNSKSTNSLHCFHNRKALLFVSLLFLITLTFSGILSEFNSGVSSFVLGASDKGVNNEAELRDAINNAPTKKSYTIAFNNDITLTGSSLVIPANKDITLTSNKAIGYYKLIGVKGVTTLVVESNGVLKLDGIIVSNGGGSMGGGVFVSVNGWFVMYAGEISGNTVADWGGPTFYGKADGGGVYNAGIFEMSGGTISGNNAVYHGTNNAGYGGGVYNTGTFSMSGGTISNNYADISGGGVYNDIGGEFTMSGGEIVNNKAGLWGGGVNNRGTFERFGGVVSGNTANVSGNNVYPDDGGSNGASGGNGGGSSSGGNGGSSNGGGSGGSGSGDGGGSANDSGTSKGDGYSLVDIVIVVVVVVGVVAGALFFYSKKKIAKIEAKISISPQDKTEE